MSLDGKPFDQLKHEDILALIPAVQENRRLDYKQALPEGNDRGAKDFLADVCAMANSAGGYLVYGVEEARDEDNKQTGVPLSVCGVAEVNEDAFKLAWQQRIAENIEPRIIGHHMRFVDGFEDGKKVMLVQVPKSLFAPHRINYGGKKEFYVRHDGGNMPMGIGEIRHAFVEGKELPQRIDECVCPSKS
ncbi:MAG: AlbA family DNA-binding domain-containing protein [Coriobacteriia bacterium]